MAVKKRKNKKTELILDAKCAKGKKRRRRGNLTGVRRRRAAARRCVRGSGVRRHVGERAGPCGGDVRCAMEEKEREQGEEKEMNADGGKDLRPPPYLLTAGGDRGRGIYCA